MQFKIEQLAIITLTEEESRIISSHTGETEFECNYFKDIIKNPVVDKSILDISKQIYATLMANDAWYCRLVKVNPPKDSIAPQIIIDPNAKQKVLFLNTCNGHEYENPIAVLVEIPAHYTPSELKAFESMQPGAGRVGTKWVDIMKYGKIPYTELKRGRKSNFTASEYDLAYTQIQGNY